VGKNFAVHDIFFMGYLFSNLFSNIKPCYGLEVHYPTWALKSVKDPGNTFILAKSGQELCRP
jgi:hypothetical protein